MDGRRARGSKTKQAVAEKAAAIASLEGLSAMSFGQLSNELGISKSSVQAAYPSKIELQLAATKSASRIFAEAVIRPALAEREGLARLWALATNWLEYVRKRRLPGGCFMCATLAEFDSAPGPVQDALRELHQGWLELLEANVAAAQLEAVIPTEPDAELVAFEIDALLSAGNIARNLSDDDSHLDLAQELIGFRLKVASADPGSRN